MAPALEVLVPNIDVMKEDKSKLPLQLRVFDVEFRARAGQIELEYGAAFQVNISPTDWDEFEQCLEKYLFGDDAPSNPAPVKRDKPLEKSPKRPRIDLSVAAPRQATSSDGKTFDTDATKVFYVFRLKSGRGPNGKNWRFSTTFAPFSISSIDGHGQSLQEIFFNPCLIRKAASPPNIEVEIADTFEHSPGDRYNETRIAGFYFGYNLIDEEENDPEDFVFRFNMHVEIPTINRGHNNSNKFHRWIPIIVDPDVGHPGGSYPPPPPGP